MSAAEGTEILVVEHVKYRNSNAGRSPIGILYIFSEHFEWKDGASPETLRYNLRDIKAQRVSPPHKPKVQLQIILQNDEQATFVFLRPGVDKEGLMKERDLVKETLQQALVAHRQRVQQLTRKNESSTRTAEIEAKQKILQQSKQLEELYKHLVSTKLVTPQDFWQHYYKNTGKVEEKMGVTGAFLANIAQTEGTNGVKLNLNSNIIQNIFTTYPIVEKKHLELVPHEVSEQEFWLKFFQSHYFHREREVVPNPSDPFADCVKQDEMEIDKLMSEGTKRKRLDFNYLHDNNFTEDIQARVLPDSEDPLESAELAEETPLMQLHAVTVQEVQRIVDVKYDASKAEKARAVVKSFLTAVDEEDILNAEDDEWMQPTCSKESLKNGRRGNSGRPPVETPLDPLRQWDDMGGPKSAYVAEIKIIHDAVAELLKHFWTCFPPTTDELQAKIERMEETMKKYENTHLSEAELKFGDKYFVHCRRMIEKAHTRYVQYKSRKRK